MHRIVGALQHYAWGHRSAIAGIRGVAPSGRPEAEYWLGAHARGPSSLLDPTGQVTATLDRVIAADPDHWLGPANEARFGELSFLFKILAAAEPLSIQAHPDAAQAQAGFNREDDEGVARDAFNRNYTDPNHKPELICALTAFEAKCGFRALTATRELMALFAGSTLRPLVSPLEVEAHESTESEVLREVTAWLLGLDDNGAADLVDEVVQQCRRLLDDEGSNPVVARFRIELEWTLRIQQHHPGDIGVVVALLLNHLTLEPGQALFLEAGVPHAYLSGVGVELMANSDNVLRGGLTPKHVDVDELLTVVDFSASTPRVQTMVGDVHRYDVPVPEFGLTGYRSTGEPATHRCVVEGPEIVLVTSGSVRLETAGPEGAGEIQLGSGEAVAVPAAANRYSLHLDGNAAMVWRATVGR